MSEQLTCNMLIVEDDPALLRMLSNFFTGCGAEVMTAIDGKNVVHLVESLQPDIILLDVVLPFQDGLSVLRNLRGVGLMMPVIILTDKDRVDDKVKGLEFGADDYMTKPFSPKELLARVKAQLRRATLPEKEMESCVTIDCLSINPFSREVLRPDNRPVPMTKTEFDLLYYLAGKEQAVVPHGELLQEVLGYNPTIETKALAMHIVNLRKKLAMAEVESVEIQSVPGVGYKLVPVAG